MNSFCISIRRLAPYVSMFFLSFVASDVVAHVDQISEARIWAEPDAWMLEVSLDHDVTGSFVAGRLDPENVEQSYVHLADEAKTLIQVSADGEILQPLAAEFKVVYDTGVYTVRYPRTGDGRLQLTHCFLDRMIDGQGTVVRSYYTDGTPGRSVFISAGHPTETVTLIKEGAAPTATDPRETEANRPEARNAGTRMGKWLWPGFSILIALIGLFWVLQRKLFSS